jgi:hypothetical protein
VEAFDWHYCIDKLWYICANSESHMAKCGGHKKCHVVMTRSEPENGDTAYLRHEVEGAMAIERIKDPT